MFLFRMYTEYSSIPASSTASEREFSRAGKSDDALRTRRNPETVRQTFRVRENYKLLNVFRRVRPPLTSEQAAATATRGRAEKDWDKWKLMLGRAPTMVRGKDGRLKLKRARSQPQGRGGLGHPAKKQKTLTRAQTDKTVKKT